MANVQLTVEQAWVRSRIFDAWHITTGEPDPLHYTHCLCGRMVVEYCRKWDETPAGQPQCSACVGWLAHFAENTPEPKPPTRKQLDDLIDHYGLDGVVAGEVGGRVVLVFDSFMVRYPESLAEAEDEIKAWEAGADMSSACDGSGCEAKCFRCRGTLKDSEEKAV